MQINWPLFIVLFSLCLPGVLIAIPRLVHFLLNAEGLKTRVSLIAVAQTLLMVLLMSFAGTVLSPQTGLRAFILEDLLLGQSVGPLKYLVIPVLLYALGGLVVFLILYYALIGSILDKESLQIMRKIRATLGLDGCILYGGVVEEVLARWGLMNVIAFFFVLLWGQSTPFLIWSSIFLSGLVFSFGQIPAYLAAGCQPSRRFIYSIMLLTLWQAILFGWLFWHYGLLAAIIAHMLFHMGWAIYDKS